MAQQYPALAVLEQVPGLFVRQKAQWIEEIVSAYEKRNKYQIKVKPPQVDAANRDEQSETTLSDDVIPAVKQLPMLWKAKEKSDCFPRSCCAPYHEWDMKIEDAQEHEILRYHRPFKCTILCPPLLCNPQEVSAILPDGGLLGKVVQNYKCCNFSNWFNVFDGAEQLIYELKVACFQFGPNCVCERFVINILLPGTEQQVWPGCNFRALCSKADNLEITFEQPIPAHHKAILLGAVFLADFLYFEKRGDGGGDF